MRKIVLLFFAMSFSFLGACGPDQGTKKDVCQTDSDCAQGMFCSSGHCVIVKTCKQKSDCPEKQQCDTKSGHCVDCLKDADCPKGKSCLHNQCQEPLSDCKTDDDCKGEAKPFCSDAGKCEWECKADGDCQADEHCEKHECKAKSGGCKTDDDCKGEAKPFCSDAGKCEWECKADGDCQADERCEKHECKAKPSGCSSNKDCKDPAKPICDFSTGNCVGCLSDGDCKDPAKGICDAKAKVCVGCLSNVDCKDPAKSICDVKGKVCVGCLSDKDCHGFKCVKNVCLTKCRRDGDCPVERPYCEKSSGYCVECFLHRDCLNSSKGHYCDSRKHQCIECTTDSHCASAKKKYCSNAGKCEWECRMSKNCPSSKPYCVNHVCVGQRQKIRKLGETCQLKNPLDAGYNDCLPNLKCFNNRCHKPCLNDKDCPQPQLCLMRYHLCFEQCLPSRGKMSNDCKGLYYCQATTEKPLAPGYCRPLQSWTYGPKKLGESCRGNSSTESCDGKAKLYCTSYYGRGNCVKACDPRKTKNGSNPDCSATEECIEDAQYSPLGGKCLGKRTRGLGESCNSTDKRCKTNLVCYGFICHQSCRSNTQCKSSEICETLAHACLPKCDPKKGLMSNDCKGLNYCYTRGSNSYCRPLPPRLNGKRKLNDSCFIHSSHLTFACDGSKDYFCDENRHRCRQACDPRKNKADGSNDKCQKNEFCKVNITSHLGGECVPKGTQKLGEFCDNFSKYCQRGLSCYRNYCQKSCSSDAQCSSGEICNTRYHVCFTKCDIKKGQMSDDCKGLYYCSREYINRKTIEVCIHLRLAGRGSQKLGESCYIAGSRSCDGSKKLMCSSSRGVCLKACDPRKTGANSDCSSNEICLVDVRYSFLGGRCVSKGTQKEGDSCNATTKRCVSGLTCYEGYCRKNCTSSNQCSSSQVCLTSRKVCLSKCDPRKGKMSSDCPGRFYCQAISSTAGYCKPLPSPQNGSRKLGERCSRYDSRLYCSASNDLFCLGRFSGTCHKACDPRLNKKDNSNINCFSREICVENVQYSHLGGECLPKPTQNLGDPCDYNKRCKSGLECWNKFCYKRCSSGYSCASGEICDKQSNICFKNCQLSHGVISNDCPGRYYCSKQRINRQFRDVCRHLAAQLQGPKKLGESCTTYSSSSYCDGKAGYFCASYRGSCAKACDPRKNSNGTNSSCSSGEECVVEINYSFLGGRCLPKATRKLGESCNSTTSRCLAGLKCLYGYCYKACSSSAQCTSSQICGTIKGACFAKCDPSKGVMSNDCKGLNYCYSLGAQSYCHPLPPKTKGTAKLGGFCDPYHPSDARHICDGSQDLFCSTTHRCVKACDPRQNQGTKNPNCASNQICVTNVRYSPLGGECK